MEVEDELDVVVPPVELDAEDDEALLSALDPVQQSPAGVSSFPLQATIALVHDIAPASKKNQTFPCFMIEPPRRVPEDNIRRYQDPGQNVYVLLNALASAGSYDDFLTWRSFGTQPVGQKVPNDWELYDMSGNVHEWVFDWLADYPNATVTDPVGPEKGTVRGVRGGQLCPGSEVFAGRQTLEPRADDTQCQRRISSRQVGLRMRASSQ